MRACLCRLRRFFVSVSAACGGFSSRFSLSLCSLYRLCRGRGPRACGASCASGAAVMGHAHGPYHKLPAPRFCLAFAWGGPCSISGLHASAARARQLGYQVERVRLAKLARAGAWPAFAVSFPAAAAAQDNSLGQASRISRRDREQPEPGRRPVSFPTDTTSQLP